MYLADKNTAHITAIKDKLQRFILDFKNDPEFRTELETLLGGSLSDAEINRYLSHQFAIEKVSLTNLKIRLDLLKKGKGAYAIDDTKRQGWRYNVGNWLDGGNSKK